ncbi:MAG: N-acetyltransferase [Bacteroidales bacterium]|nr:N-acetyltransferase [Bacteroidales bacterium]
MNVHNFQFIKTASGGMFYLGDKVYPDAHIDFSDSGDGLISADNTEVKPELSGQGLAKELVLTLIDYAKEENLKIVPVCSYVEAFFKKNEDYKPVLAAEAKL